MFNFFSEIKQDIVYDNALLGNFNIINLSNKAVYIEGHKGLVSLKQEEICFRAKKTKIKILGDALKIKKITTSTAIIEGEIKGVALE